MHAAESGAGGRARGRSSARPGGARRLREAHRRQSTDRIRACPFRSASRAASSSAGRANDCPVCEDARQWVPEDGQQWTTYEELRAGHHNAIRPEGELTGIGTQPRFAIGQRALLVPHGERNVLWDCITLLDDATVAEIDGPRRARRDRDLAPALLLGDGRMGAPLRVPGPAPRGRPRVGDARRPGDRVLVGRDLRPRRGPDADPLRRPLRGRHRPAPARATCSPATSSRSSRTAAGSRSCTAIRT